MKSWTSVQVGTAIGGYNLYRNRSFQTVCAETCDREDLRDTVHDAIQDYNPAHATYANEIFDARLPLVSPTPDTWRAP